MASLRRILVPIDFSGCSEAAIHAAVALATAFDAKLMLLHAYEIPTYSYPGAPFIPVVDIASSVAESAQIGLDTTLREVVPQWKRTEAILRCGNPWLEILDAAKSLEADLIVMGTHGRRGLAHALLGSVAEKIVRMSPIPVLTVRAESRGDAASCSSLPT